MVGFLDARSREQILAPVPAAGGALVMREWPVAGMDLRIDAVTSSGRSSVSIPGGPSSVRYDLLTAGVALPWRARPEWLGGLELLGGPRVSLLWLRRSFDTAGFPSVPQSYTTVTPGLLAGFELPLFKGLSLGGELHLDWALVQIDGQDRSTALAEGLLGLGWRF